MDRSLHGWAENFGSVNKKNRIGMYDTDVYADYLRLENSGLPTYKRILTTPSDFLYNKDKYKHFFVFERYYAQVYPLAIGLKKHHIMDFKDFDEVEMFLHDTINGLYDKYILLVSEFEPNIFGGSVMSDGNNVRIDIIRGLQNQISYGKKADFTYIEDANGIIKYCNCGKHEKYLVYEILDSIRIYNERKKYMSGYLEFAFTQKSTDGSLRLVYFDLKKQNRFLAF